jgi:hypothetical protein
MKRLIASCFTLWCVLAAAETAQVHDGAWWLSVSTDRRTGFLAGYIDCAVYDAGEKQFADLSWDAIEPQISKRFLSHPADRGTRVADVLAQIGKKQQISGGQSDGESYPEKHGIFNGDYWRQSNADKRLGYVNGYLECHAITGKPKADYSRDSVWYSNQISLWFGVKADDPGEINPDRVNRKIADALYMFRTKEPKKEGR